MVRVPRASKRMSDGTVTLGAQSHVAKCSALGVTLHCTSSALRWRTARVHAHAGSTSLCLHRRKLSGVGNVLVIAFKLNRSSPSSKPWMRRRQERSECIVSVHSNHRPWTANCLSVANWLSVSISAMMLRFSPWLIRYFLTIVHRPTVKKANLPLNPTSNKHRPSESREEGLLSGNLLVSKLVSCPLFQKRRF